MKQLPALLALSLFVLSACKAAPIAATPENIASRPFAVQEIAHFNEPWAMAFLPEYNQALITQRDGKLMLWESEGAVSEVAGVPKVDFGGQGGLGDVAISPEYRSDHLIYLSWVVAEDGDIRGAVVGRAKLEMDGDKPSLQNLTIIWRQSPKVTGRGHFGHRIAFGSNRKLYISSGERQKFEPAQDDATNLGKIIVMNPDGSDAHNLTKGHRNPLGLAFDQAGRLWEIEMGPQGGDELNLVKQGANYGWPRASNGTHYDGRDIPDHKMGDGFEAPKLWWNPSISPGSLMIYTGSLFPEWKGDAFIGALGGQALLRVDLDGENAAKAEAWPMEARIREVEQGPDGAIWLLEDGEAGRLLKLNPKI